MGCCFWFAGTGRDSIPPGAGEISRPGATTFCRRAKERMKLVSFDETLFYEVMNRKINRPPAETVPKEKEEP